ncbi:ATP-binding protein [Pyrofollis japonicus]|uniref:ATP-binding protein n=1 Tax=Pyrofollis japonicus TaxID=3060460 RepID=UPI00295ABC70|nr:ATP-binding protein [Pyrofollis japonicus]BEP18462.1 ATP-binding protein [Pyrofollis japonicus]
MTRQTNVARPVGMVTGDARPDYFVFTADPDNIPRLYDYVYIEAKEVPPGENEPVTVKVLAQIRSIRRLALGVSPEHPWPVLRNLSLPRGSDTVIASAKVLGYKWRGGIYYPRHAPPVGSWVYLAPDDLLKEFYSVEEPRRLHVGYLISRPSVPAFLDLEGIKRHVAIIAATGAGKTWASVVLIEELLKKGATIVVLDPHGEYAAMKRTAYRLGQGFENAVRVLKGHREQEGDLQYRVSIADMSAEELATIAGIPSKANRIRSVIYGAKRLSAWMSEATGDPRWRGLRGIIKIIQSAIDAMEITRMQNNMRLDVFAQNLVTRLALKTGWENERLKELQKRLKELIASDEEIGKGIRRLWLSLSRDTSPGYDAIRYLDELLRIGVYGVKTIPLDVLLEPGTVTVVNLAGLRAEVQDHLVYNILYRIFTARLRYLRRIPGESYPYPVVVVLEEAHRFVPPKSQKQTRSRDIVATIASEGRKFGVFIVAITQRPSRIDPDVLSQLQGQIILRIVNPRDQEAIRDSSEQVSQDLLDNLPGLNTGEAVVVGPLSPAPIMMRLRDRVLSYSGGDISLVEAWGASRSDMKLLEEMKQDALEKISALTGEKYRDLAEALAELTGLDVGSKDVDKALRLIVRESVWASYNDEVGVIYGEVIYHDGRSCEVRIDIASRTPYCSCCGNRVCGHVVAVLIRAVLDNVIPVGAEARSEPWSDLL